MDNVNLWAPWRMEYIRQLGSDPNSGSDGSPSTCFLCAPGSAPGSAPASAPGGAPGGAPASSAEGAQGLTLVNDGRGLIVLNKYPYCNGHLLAAPHQHVASLSDLSAAERAGLMELAELSERLLRTAMNPQGLNIGINMGRCAGAGLPGHLHMHIVPRWSGDTNFMATLGQVRVIPQALDECYDWLAQTLRKLEQRHER